MSHLCLSSIPAKRLISPEMNDDAPLGTIICLIIDLVHFMREGKKKTIFNMKHELTSIIV